MPINGRLRRRFRERDPAYGLWVTVSSTAVVEIAAELNLDWVCIDLEHGGLTYREVESLITAANGTDMSVLVRPPCHDLEPTKRVLDLGAQGVIVPLIEHAGQVELVAQHCYYPPKGKRGIGGERNVRWGLRLAEYLERANDELLLIPMIETVAGVDAIDDILALDPVEAIFIGPGDLSASFGHVGQWEGPGVADAIAGVVGSAQRAAVTSGIVARSATEARERRDQGFGMIALGSDLGLMIRAIGDIGQVLGRTRVDHRWF
jgi:2-keto-3-deoxy-L-rhamnonate aldolase RhmA